MTYYAWFDSTAPQPAHVLGWYDSSFNPNLPAQTNLLEVTSEQWSTGTATSNNWAVSGGSLVPWAPPQSLLLQSQLLLADNLANGISIISNSTPAVNATYALDTVSTAQIYQIGIYANGFGTFPGGFATQYYPDTTGTPHPFSVSVFISFLHAVAGLVAALNTQQGIMAAGGSPSWPSQTYTIT